MTYEIMTNLEKMFEEYPTEEALHEYLIKSDYGEAATINIINWYKIYTTGNSEWEGCKFRNSNDVLKIENKKSINDVVETIIENKNFSNKILIKLENRTYDDISSLDQFNKKYNIIIYYDGITCTLDEFKSMRATIDYYKYLIDNNNLSPLEIITFIYDLIKSFKYIRDESDVTISRNIHSIIRDGIIVCVGYSKFMKQLLKEYDINAYVMNVITENGEHHERLMLKIIDEKYGINGIYAFDPTFDSAKDIYLCKDINGKFYYKPSIDIKDTDEKIRQLDNTCLYRRFMIPVSQYAKEFPNEKIISMDTKEGKKKADKQLINTLEHGFDKVPRKKIDLKLFIHLMYNVKLAEGFLEENIVDYINDLIGINEISNYKETVIIQSTIKELKENKHIAA